MVHLIVAITGAHRAPDLPLAAAVALGPSSGCRSRSRSWMCQYHRFKRKSWRFVAGEDVKRWNLEHVVLDLFSHFTLGKVQVRWLFVSCRGSRSPNSPFAHSRLANLTHAVAARLRLSVPTWQHVHRRVLRELDIEFEPTRDWTSSFFTACSSHGNSRRLASSIGRRWSSVSISQKQNAFWRRDSRGASRGRCRRRSQRQRATDARDGATGTQSQQRQ